MLNIYKAKISKCIDRYWIQIVVLLTIFAFIFNVLLFYPGYMSSDTIAMLYTALGDTPSNVAPVMLGVMWRALYYLTGNISSILIFQLIMLWLSLSLLSVYIYKKINSKLLSFLCLFIGGLPFVLNISGVIWRDCQMTFSLMLATVLILFINDIKNKIFRVILFAFIIILILYAGVSRYNAIIAIVPLLFFAFRYSGIVKKLRWQLMLSLASIPLIFLILFPLINMSIGATEANNQPGLMLDDIIEVSNSDTLSKIDMPDELRTTFLEIRSCSKDVIVSNIYACTDNNRSILYKYHNEFPNIWFNVIINNPGNYLFYKLRMFMTIIFPKYDYPYIWQGGIEDNRINLTVKFHELLTANSFYVNRIGYKYLRAAFEPWFWLLSASVLLYLSNKKEWVKNKFIINTLCISSILYILGYIPTGATPDYRYYYWSVLAVILAFILLLKNKFIISIKEASKDTVLKSNRKTNKNVSKKH